MAFPDLEDLCFRVGLDSFLASSSLAASSLIFLNLFRAGADSFFRCLGLLVLATLFCGGILVSSEVALPISFPSPDSSASSDSDSLGRFPVLLTPYFARSLLSASSFGVRFSASELSHCV